MQTWAIKNIVVPFLLKFLNEMLTGDNVKVVLDKLFDFIEDAVQDSKTNYDDLVVLPTIKSLRAMLNVPDDD